MKYFYNSTRIPLYLNEDAFISTEMFSTYTWKTYIKISVEILGNLIFFPGSFIADNRSH